jgi:meso-butanediol dehydrogenase/(S,S)-butanediol dehydrogenase/diacetyl reductase
VGLIKQLAFNLGPLRIRVNAVASGIVRTSLTDSYFNDANKFQRTNAAYPLGSVAEPEDLAEVVLYIATDATRFVSGAVIPVDGGDTAGKRW